jgi:hypothetical protein
VALVDSDRIELFLDRAAVLRSSRAAASIDETTMTINFSGDGSDIEIDLDAPDDEETLVYFARVRAFDTRGTDLYVADFFPVLVKGAGPSRRAVVDWITRAHEDLGREGYDRPSHVLGTGATPRQVWELWTYGFLLHTDMAKRAVWSGLDDYQKGAAKFVAYSYAADLFHLVTVVEAMLRDPLLDASGVRMQELRLDPRSGRTFSAAKVRLP